MMRVCRWGGRGIRRWCRWVGLVVGELRGVVVSKRWELEVVKLALLMCVW